MNKSVSLGIVVIVLVLLTVLLVLPVSGMVAPENVVTTNTVIINTGTITPVTTGVISGNPTISATVSSTTPTVGDPVIISGVATGGNLAEGVQMWVFAGNYVNVATLPVNADGTFSKTYQTATLPPAKYFVFVQSPAADGKFDIDLIESGARIGQVINTRTNERVFNFTGVGSVNDEAASKALSDALNLPEQDDKYTKLTIQLGAPVVVPQAAATSATAPATSAAPATATTATTTPTAKSPLPIEVTTGALVISGCCAAFCMRKTH
jgi:hypothetical protein